MASIGGANIVTDGLVLSLDAANKRSYSGSGTAFADLSGNFYSSTLTNGPTFSTTNNGGITFDGVDDYAEGNNSLASVISTAITLIVFAKVSNFNNRVPLFTKYQSIPLSPDGYVLEVGTLAGLWTRTMRFFAGGDNGAGSKISSDYRGTIPLTDNNVYMFTAQYEPNTSTMKMYYNTTEMTATQVNANWNSVLNWGAGTNLYYLGAYSPTVGVYGSSTIYNTLIYNRIISYSEIQQNYNAIKSRFNL